MFGARYQDFYIGPFGSIALDISDTGIDSKRDFETLQRWIWDGGHKMVDRLKVTMRLWDELAGGHPRFMSWSEWSKED